MHCMVKQVIDILYQEFTVCTVCHSGADDELRYNPRSN